MKVKTQGLKVKISTGRISKIDEVSLHIVLTLPVPITGEEKK